MHPFSKQAYDQAYSVLKSIYDSPDEAKPIEKDEVYTLLRLVYLVSPDDPVTQYSLKNTTYPNHSKHSQDLSLYPTSEYRYPVYCDNQQALNDSFESDDDGDGDIFCDMINCFTLDMGSENDDAQPAPNLLPLRDRGNKFRPDLFRNQVHLPLIYYGYEIMFGREQTPVGYDCSEIIVKLSNDDIYSTLFYGSRGPNRFKHYPFNAYEPGDLNFGDDNNADEDASGEPEEHRYTYDNDRGKTDFNEPLYHQCHYKVKTNSDERVYIFKTPNNDNERDGKVLMFVNAKLKTALESRLADLFDKQTFYLNDVFKWNRYYRGGKFDAHYDTMFVDHQKSACSLYTLLIYMNVELPNANFMYLGENEEVIVPLTENTMYVLPHWVKHRVEGEGFREFIKTEIVFPINKQPQIQFNDKIQKDFDLNCYLMLQSIKHPELKQNVSWRFNQVNRHRFESILGKPIEDETKLEECILFFKTLNNVPVTVDYKLTTCDNLSYACDGLYYYFKVDEKIKTLKDVDRQTLRMMVSLMYVDVHPKKLNRYQYELCLCKCPSDTNNEKVCTKDLYVDENVVYSRPEDKLKIVAEKLPVNVLPVEPINPGVYYDLEHIAYVNVDLEPFEYYFAACQNIYDVIEVYHMLYSYVQFDNDDLVKTDAIELLDGNIVKIRQKSFNNGITVTEKYSGRWTRKDRFRQRHSDSDWEDEYGKYSNNDEKNVATND